LQLQEKVETSTHILLLINDAAIETFISTHLQQSKAYKIHFSGALVTDKAYGLHPLMTFNTSLYDLAKYQSIAFVIDHDAPAFADLLPGLSNPHVYLNKSLKPKYHALCVMAANFSCILWQKLFTSFEAELSIPHSLAFPFLQQQTQNLIANYQTALTGPLVRGDQLTIQKNINALENDPFQQIYKTFVEHYSQISQELLPPTGEGAQRADGGIKFPNTNTTTTEETP
jgi:predicted short-subunit dehydrogenase-like oxidoreductase (DUF2520 family)